MSGTTRQRWTFSLICLIAFTLRTVHSKNCIGYEITTSISGSAGQQYEGYRKMYAGCTFVERNLIIVNLDMNPLNDSYDFSFLKDIREVQDAIFIKGNMFTNNPISLPNLHVIRGRRTYQNKYSLYVQENHGHGELQLPSLQEILYGDVLFQYNKLCFDHLIDWPYIFKYRPEQTAELNDSECEEVNKGRCHPNCSATSRGHCWGAGPDMCQMMDGLQCPGSESRCTKSGKACDIQCAGGCNGTSASECLACRNVVDGEKCLEKCPSEKTKYDIRDAVYVPDLTFRYTYFSQCVKSCEDKLVQNGLHCVNTCPSTYMETEDDNSDQRICVYCGNNCPKKTVCNMTKAITSENIFLLKNCTHVRGHISIDQITLSGFNNITALTELDLEVLNTVEEISEYLYVTGNSYGSRPISSLSFLRNLRIIRGQSLTVAGNHEFSLLIMGTDLEYLGLVSLKKLYKGKAGIASNTNLCLSLNGSSLVKSGIWMPINNKNLTDCVSEKRGCSEQCSDQNCWGPGDDKCLHCKFYRYKENKTCISSCNQPGQLMFETIIDDVKVCSACHPQCVDGCRGDGADRCFRCLTVKKIYNESYSECLSACPHKWTADADNVCEMDMEIRNQAAMIASIVVVVVVLLVVFLILLFVYRYNRRQRHLLKIVDAIPMMSTDAVPDQSLLRLIKETELKRLNSIGTGAFGTVYKGFWIPEKENLKIPVAIKVLTDDSTCQTAELLDEARIMASVNHPYCIRIIAVCMTTPMQLVTPLMPHGSLLDFIRKHRTNVGSKSLLTWSVQIAKGMEYLEQRGIVHRDLAARNILVQSSNRVKLTDFGLAKLLEHDKGEFYAASGKMPIKWLAPESILDRIYTHKSDVWSYGVTLWEMFTYGKRPYEDIEARNVPDAIEKGERLPQPEICTIDVYMILIKCWMPNPISRPTFTDLAKEFTKMAGDPARFLVVTGDKLMRLHSTIKSNQELLRGISGMEEFASEGPEKLIDADDYLNPNNLDVLVEEDSSLTIEYDEAKLKSGKQPNSSQARVDACEENVYVKSTKKNNPNVAASGRQPSQRAQYGGGNKSVKNSDKFTEPLLGDYVNTEYPKLTVDECGYLEPKSESVSPYLDLLGEEPEIYLTGDATKDNEAAYVNSTNPPTHMSNPEYCLQPSARK